MTSQQDIPLYDEVVNGFDNWADYISPNETSDLRKTRRQAFEKFRESGFPSIRNEDWKYTNLTRFLKDEYRLGSSTPFVLSPALPLEIGAHLSEG